MWISGLAVPAEVGDLDVEIDTFSLIASGIEGPHERRIGYGHRYPYTP